MGRSPYCDENNLKKGPWTSEEDQMLLHYIQQHGHGNWRALPKLAGLRRCGKSCRLRWTNYLRPDIKRGKFSKQEEDTILHYHSILGNKWSTIATNLPGRTDNEIKNYWNTHLKKRLIQMGVDPMTHQPRTDLFSCLPQLIALSNLKELLEHNQLVHNLQYLNLLLQPSLSIRTDNTGSGSILDLTNSISSIHEENPYFVNNFLSELRQGREEMIQFPMEYSFQPLQQVPIMDLQTINDHEVVGDVINANSSPTWTPLPPLIDPSVRTTTTTTTTTITNSLESSATISNGGGGAGEGFFSYNWLDFLFDDVFLNENLQEMC